MSMSRDKPVPLIGRLAVQLKLIGMEQLSEATEVQGREPERNLGSIFVEKGFISSRQLERLVNVQAELIAKHRARKAAGGPVVPPPEIKLKKRVVSSAPPATRAAPSRVGKGAAAPAAPSQAPAAAVPVPTVPRPPESKPAPAAPTPVPAAATAVAEPALELSIADPAEADCERLHQMLRDAVLAGASDIHVHAGAKPQHRVNGKLLALGATSMDPEEAERLVAASLTVEERARLVRRGELDFCLSVDGIGRFRANAYRQQHGFDVTFRSIPAEPPTLDDLGLPRELAKFTNYHQGMVLITGPAGCGKSSTMAALVNLVNEEREEHILTVEDPIEVIHPSKRCLVNQRHAGCHTESFARALRGALREDPDIIVIGELRDLETISLAMTAAETGHFVLATLHTSNAVRTINRMIGAFPSNQQGQVRTMLSESLRAVISQRLVPTADESGRVPALEILVINKAISNLVREEKTVQIRSALQTGRSHGMVLLEQSLNELFKSGIVTREEALKNAEDKRLITG